MGAQQDLEEGHEVEMEVEEHGAGAGSLCADCAALSDGRGCRWAARDGGRGARGWSRFAVRFRIVPHFLMGGAVGGQHEMGVEGQVGLLFYGDRTPFSTRVRIRG